ncbi:MAG: hypothetical protein ACN6O2_16550 [Stenotrophomonas sp.]
MIRLAVYGLLLVFFADMFRKALMVRADSFVLPILAICIWLLVLIVRRWRHLYRRITRNRTGFIRPSSFPAQRKRDIR